MAEYKVTCYAIEEIFVDAKSEEEAKLLAIEECSFSCIDCCEVEEQE